MSRTCRAIGVVVPARDEGDTIAGCVHSIRRSLRAAAADTCIVVVADDCSDDTAVRARAALDADGEVIERTARSVGAARRAGCERALGHFRSVARGELLLMATDGDSTVPRDWVSAHLAEIGRGASAVAGTVVVDSFTGRHPHLRASFERAYAPRRGESHRHVHGANLSVVADAYLAVGGFAALVTGEEHDLWARLRVAGYATVSSTASPVVTSGRRVGRAEAGFAAYLDRIEGLLSEASA